MPGADYTFPPTTAEIGKLDWNGFSVASLFAGAGGSSFGYRMAGFRMLYVNEFVELAREVYSRYSAPYTVIDDRDIRDVTPESILDMTGLDVGDLDILDGSPPCAAFSSLGNREKAWGQVKKYSDRAQVVDDLFFEYARILRGLRPKVFVAENVAGLVRGKAKGYYQQIHRELRDCGYRVSARILDASRLGVPQTRSRLIFVGVRDDLGLDPCHPKPQKRVFAIRDVVTIPEGWTLVRGKHVWNCWDNGVPIRLDRPCPALQASPHVIGGIPSFFRDDSLNKYVYTPIWFARDISTFPPDHDLTDLLKSKGWERYGRSVPPVMMRAIARAVLEGVLWKV